jgi:hypothetical protein
MHSYRNENGTLDAIIDSIQDTFIAPCVLRGMPLRQSQLAGKLVMKVYWV